MSSDPKATAAFYDSRGKAALRRSERKYGALDAPLYIRAPYSFVEDQLSQAKSHGAVNVLDLCCGTGTHSIAAAKLGLLVTGVDVSGASIESAKSLASQFGVHHLCEFVVSSFEEYVTMVPQKFDVVLISGSLYYLNLDYFLSMSSSLLREKGTFICVETYGSNPFMAAIRRIKNLFYGHRDRMTLEGLLKKNEIETVSSRFAESKVVYFDFLTLVGFIFPENSIISRYWHAIARRADQTLLNGGRLHFLAFKFVIVAVL